MTNEDLVRQTGLPNLDTISDIERLLNLADIADRKVNLQSNTDQRSEAFRIYSDRAYELVDAIEEAEENV